MVKVRRNDVIAGLVAGEASGLLSLFVFKNLAVNLGLARWGIIIALPLLAVLGLFIAAWLSRFWATLWQIAKFLLVGILNTLVDFGILNLLIYLTGAASGLSYVLFKSISFTGAVVNSYMWNKFWTFEERERKGGKEFLQFLLVSIVAFLINVGAASFIDTVVGPQRGFSPNLWANLAALVGTVLAFLANFLGYKFIVFR